MKKFISMILAVILVFSVTTPITVFAENGPHIIDPEDENLNIDTLSMIAFMYMGDLIEFDATNKMFTNPSQQQTEDYITGRFG